MRSTPTLNALDMLSKLKTQAAQKGKKPETGFQDLFDEALGSAEKTKPAKKPQHPEPEATPPQADDAALSNAAAAAAEPAQQPALNAEPEATPAEAGTGTATVVTPGTPEPAAETTAATQTAPAAQTAATSQAATTAAAPAGDILSMQLAGASSAASEAPAAPTAAPLPGQIVTAPPQEGGKLGTMLDQAQQQLQQLSTPAATVPEAAPQTAPVQESAVQAAVAQETTVQETDAAAEAPAAPVTVLPEAAKPVAPAEEAGVPVNTGEEAPADQLPTDAAPAEEAPAAEDAQPAPLPERTPATPEQTAARPADQQALRNQSEADRAVLQMRESAAQRQRVEPVHAEETAAATQAAPQTQSTQQAAPAQQARPVPQQPELPAQQADQIRIQVAENLDKGRTEFRMQLEPAELGKISVRLVMDGGRLAVEIVTNGTRTAELLNRQAEALGTALRAHTGVQVTSVNIVSESQNASGNMNSPFGANAGTENGAFQQGAQHRHGTAPGQQSEHADFAGPDEETETAPDTRLDTTI